MNRYIVDYSLQVHFPAFIGSSVYLRFLNELVQMLNKDNDSTARNAKTEPDGTPSEAVLKLSHTVMGRDLDDPDSLWLRPSLLYAIVIILLGIGLSSGSWP